MTEKEAWLYLAREFGRPRKERIGGPADYNPSINGLCYAVIELHARNFSITADTRETMEQKLLIAVVEEGYLGNRKRDLVGERDPLYLAPYDDEGDKVRVALCLKLAAELEG